MRLMTGRTERGMEWATGKKHLEGAERALS
jgi:hypothetical protein